MKKLIYGSWLICCGLAGGYIGHLYVVTHDPHVKKINQQALEDAIKKADTFMVTTTSNEPIRTVLYFYKADKHPSCDPRFNEDISYAFLYFDGNGQLEQWTAASNNGWVTLK